MPQPHSATPFTPRVVTRVRLFGYALAAAVLFSFLPLPWGMAGFPFAVAAIVLGLVAMAAMRGGASTGLWTFVVLGVFVSGSLSLNYAVGVLLFDEIREYDHCMSRAITITAEDQCHREFDEAARERLKRLGIPVSWVVESES